LGISDLPPVINAYNQFALPKYCAAASTPSADGTKWNI
jgi:hypothetical protein